MENQHTEGCVICAQITKVDGYTMNATFDGGAESVVKIPIRANFCPHCARPFFDSSRKIAVNSATELREQCKKDLEYLQAQYEKSHPEIFNLIKEAFTQPEAARLRKEVNEKIFGESDVPEDFEPRHVSASVWGLSIAAKDAIMEHPELLEKKDDM